jgi:hypothetical protein
MSTSQTMSPEDFIAWATSEIEIAKSEKGEAAVARLDNVRKQIEVAKAFSFEGDVAGLPVEQVATPAPSATEVSPKTAQQDDPSSTTATNFDEVAKRLTDDLDVLKKALDDKGEGDGTDDGNADDGNADDGNADDGNADDDKSNVDKGNDAPAVTWPDDMNDAEGDLAWGSDGDRGSSE